MQENPLFQVVEAYLDSVKTNKDSRPNIQQRENFLLTCLTNNLNPIKKQVYLIGFESKSGPIFNEIISVTGQTAIASRTGEYAGVSQPRFTFKNDKIDSCSVTVTRLVKGQKCEFAGQAYFEERSKDNFGNIKKEFQNQPRTMLEKCARAIALRNAFPEELGNYYEEAEINFVDSPVTNNNSKETKVFISNTQKVELNELLKTASKLSGKSSEEIIKKILEAFKFKTIDDVYEPHATKIIEAVKARIAQYEQASEELNEFETE